jgi:predicted ester cyclase
VGQKAVPNYIAPFTIGLASEAALHGRSRQTATQRHHVRVFLSRLNQQRNIRAFDALHRAGETNAMTKEDLSSIYRDYIDCLNKQDWPSLEQFVHHEVRHNGKQIGVPGYRKMLEADFEEIPDLHFNIQLLVCDPPYIASRLAFNCSPKGNFLGLEITGKRVAFTENVFYEFRTVKIYQVWSVVDKLAIEAQV